MQATNKLILGTVQFGLDYGINNNTGKPNLDEVVRILDYAHENNIRLLDTAEAYGNAQELIGEYHRISKNKFEVITKFSPVQNDIIGSLTLQVERNLKTLNVDELYGYMFHSFRDFEFYFEPLKQELTALKNEGKIRKFGVSVYLNSELEALLEYNEVKLIQIPFNLLDNANQRSALLAKAKEKGIEVHTRSAFLQGLFFVENEKLQGKLKLIERHLEYIKALSLKTGKNLVELALNYVLQQKYIDYAVIGVDNQKQLELNLKALRNKLEPITIEEINSIVVKETELLNPSNWNS